MVIWRLSDQIPDLTCLYQINVQARPMGTHFLTNVRIYVPIKGTPYTKLQIGVITSSYLCVVIVVGAQHFLDSVALLQQFRHGAFVGENVSLCFLLSVERLRKVVPKSHRDTQPSQCPVKPGLK